jgi:hypothetical protein
MFRILSVLFLANVEHIRKKEEELMSTVPTIGDSEFAILLRYEVGIRESAKQNRD